MVVAAPEVIAVPRATAIPIGFRNADTMRAALLSVAITFLPSTAVAQFSPILFFGGLFVNGLLGVLLFLRRTGRGMTTIEGARQGWISGLLFFGIMFLLTGLSMLFAAKNGVAEMIREQAKVQGTLTPEVAKILNDGSFLTGFVFIASVVMFVLFTSLASVGGMLGARLFGSASRRGTEEPGR